MSESVSLRDRYLALIDEIVDITLKGKISSVEQVYQMLLKSVTVGTGEIFELVLSDRLNAIQQQVNTEKDELKKAKATRTLRAIKTIQSQWQRAEEQNKATEATAAAIKEITTAPTGERLAVFLRVTDSNRKNPLNIQQIQQLSKSLQQFAQADEDFQYIADGITRGIAAWQRLQEHLVSWMYEQSQDSLGFGGIPGESGPWAAWAKQTNSELPKTLLRTLAMEESVIAFAEQQRNVNLSDWVEITLILQYLQRGLVHWFDQQPYNVKAGSKLSISTFLTFAVIWSQLADGFGLSTIYGNAASQVMLQILRTFSQRQYFPLYGGIFASFAGSYLRDALNYLDEPLRRVEGTQEKARILTLLGYSQRALGQYDRSINFHQQALEIARNAGDRPCEIANLNHLSRTCVAQQNYSEAIDYSQRALILSRQTGNRTGEAYALVNLGYSEVMQAQQLQELEPETYEMAINYLQQGLRLSEQLGDVQSKALCLSSLGIAYLIIQQPENAIKNLEEGFRTAQLAGDLYLQGLNLATLGEANYNLANFERAIYTGCLGMYLLNQIASQEWRKPAGLLTILQGQLGTEAFQNTLQQNRQRIISVIGIDGYDYIPQLLEEYRQEM
ncbi:tetratricopeptide repeat protein [Chlorogloeopsis sp. ULAP02]|uniref:tetratricopeptide repeat protein n=1 Tax=Chlorogloeopsis sp. ULAP02 TaxID=3107926 RepID=UPI00313516DF